MKNYTFIYRAPPGGPVSENTDEGMKAWMEWFEKIKADGSLVDMGAGFIADAKLVSEDGIVDGRAEFKDGMFIMGYTVVKADSLDAAAEIAAGSPAAAQKCSIEVRQAAEGPSK